ncbi:MAG TPA: NAD(P)-binding domain-containing protein [Acidimicrobiales bacterium]|nr:NAD(P)-binding domain-containing protein [Acidimicrobiales bacterium]
MDIAVIGTGFIGRTLGVALARAGHTVTFGSRHPKDDALDATERVTVGSVEQALGAGDVIILAVPGAAVADLGAQYGAALVGKLVIDATNQMRQEVANSRADLPAGIRYARAFNTLGGENMADPNFADGPADMFFSAPDADRAAVEKIVADVGLRPIYVGADQEELIDALFRLWIALAVGQGRGRRLALRLLEG